MPGPSCPYDRAGRRGALPFFGKLQPWRAGPGPGWGRSSAAKQQAARRGPLERTAASRQLPRPPGPGFWLPYCFYSRAEAPRCFKSCFWGCSALRGKVKAAHPIARRRTLSYSHAGEREMGDGSVTAIGTGPVSARMVNQVSRFRVWHHPH